MARTKAARKPPKRKRHDSVRNPTGRPRLPSALTLKGGQAWRDWLAAYARHKGMDRTKVVDKALALMAACDNYKLPPDREA